MGLLDGLSEQEIFESKRLASKVLVAVSNKFMSGELTAGDDYVVTDEEALALVRYHLIGFLQPQGLPEPTSSEPFPAVIANSIQFVSNDGRVFKGDASAVDDTLAKVQIALLKLIDAKAEDSIINGPGFTHASKQFSLSHAAQTKWNGLYANRASMSYPYVVPTKDDQNYHSIADAAEVETMYQAAVAAVTTELDSANAAKQNVVAAASTTAARTAADAYLT